MTHPLKSTTKVRHPLTAATIKQVGGVYALASALGISAAAVSKWTLIPAHHVAKIAALCGRRPEEIRPHP